MPRNSPSLGPAADQLNEDIFFEVLEGPPRGQWRFPRDRRVRVCYVDVMTSDWMHLSLKAARQKRVYVVWFAVTSEAVAKHVFRLL